jgi:hypothetical protein
VKDQYFGDVSDFIKYALLRRLVGDDLRAFVVWMLTAPDDRTHGASVGYLKQPQRYRHIDPALFDSLRDAVDAGPRGIAVAEDIRVIPRAAHQPGLLLDSASSRRTYFAHAREASRGYDVVFFDPDNGIEVASTSRRRRDASKYLFWDEVTAAHESKASLVIYQHFPRVHRDQFVDALCRRIDERLGSRAFGVRSPRAAFLVVPQPWHDHLLRTRTATFARDSRGIVTTDATNQS